MTKVKGQGAPSGREAPLIVGFESNGINGTKVKDCRTLLEGVQGNILKSHGREHSRFLFIRFDLRTAVQRENTRTLIGMLGNGLGEEPAIDAEKQRFLENDAEWKVLEENKFKITSAWDQHSSRVEFRKLVEAAKINPGSIRLEAASSMHVGFLLSSDGYRALGFSEKEIPDDEGFKRGMKHPFTTEYLSDPPAHPDWESPYQDAIHALLILAHDDMDKLEKVTGIVAKLIGKYGVLVGTEKGKVLREGAKDVKDPLILKTLPPIEHFGFRDGISQPLFFRDEIQKAREHGFEYILTLPKRLELEQLESTKARIEEEENRVKTLQTEVVPKAMAGHRKAMEKKTQLDRMQVDCRHQISSLESRIAETKSVLDAMRTRVRVFLPRFFAVEDEIISAIAEFTVSDYSETTLAQVIGKIESAKAKWDSSLSALRMQKPEAMPEEDSKRWQGIVEKHVLLIEDQYEDLKAFSNKPNPTGIDGIRTHKRECLRILHTLKDRLAIIGRSQWDPSAPLDLVLAKEPGGEGFGSYFVFRKLKQDVKAFRKIAEARAARRSSAEGYALAAGTPHRSMEMESAQEMEEARMVGRTKSGCPLAWGEKGSAQQVPDGRYVAPDNFNYEQDGQGRKCPFHAHIRTVNPRGATGNAYDEKSRRIARRGVPYEDGDEKGLLFLCAQSNIREQFEYMQKLWANNPDFPANAYPHAGPDPIIGRSASERSAPRGASYGHGSGYGKAADYGVVSLKGGEYFFAPSIPFLKAGARYKEESV